MRMPRWALIPIGALALNAGTISTQFNSDNGGWGNYFDITSLSASPITILATFRINSESTTLETFSVYYKTGSYVGSETNSAAWTLLGTDTEVGQGTNNPTSINVGSTFVMGAGLTDALYIVSDSFIAYTDGNTTVSDGNLTLTLGSGSSNPAFSASFPTDRIWNGQLDYSIGNQSVPEPASLGLIAAALGLLVVVTPPELEPL